MLAEFTVKYVIQKILKSYLITLKSFLLDFYIERNIFILIHKMQVI